MAVLGEVITIGIRPTLTERNAHREVASLPLYTRPTIVAVGTPQASTTIYRMRAYLTASGVYGSWSSTGAPVTTHPQGLAYDPATLTIFATGG